MSERIGVDHHHSICRNWISIYQYDGPTGITQSTAKTILFKRFKNIYK